MTKNSIALIGFMATGKSTIGKVLVRYLGKDYKFIETDQIVVQKAGKSISRIFDEDGEGKFREYEALVIEEASKLSKIVVSCGGGAVLNKNNITYKLFLVRFFLWKSLKIRQWKQHKKKILTIF